MNYSLQRIFREIINFYIEYKYIIILLKLFFAHRSNNILEDKTNLREILRLIFIVRFGETNACLSFACWTAYSEGQVMLSLYNHYFWGDKNGIRLFRKIMHTWIFFFFFLYIILDLLIHVGLGFLTKLFVLFKVVLVLPRLINLFFFFGLHWNSPVGISYWINMICKGNFFPAASVSEREKKWPK